MPSNYKLNTNKSDNHIFTTEITKEEYEAFDENCIIKNGTIETTYKKLTTKNLKGETFYGKKTKQTETNIKTSNLYIMANNFNIGYFSNYKKNIYKKSERRVSISSCVYIASKFICIHYALYCYI